MARKIMYAISNVEGDSKKKIYCENLEKNEYEAKYKGYLTCIKGCQARIKVKSKFVCKFIFQLCGFIYATFIFKRFD